MPFFARSEGSNNDDTLEIELRTKGDHLDLNFDINEDVVRNGEKKTVRDSAFLHVGHYIHVDVLKAFMQQNNVSFQEG